jgi:hypothetical protein
VAERKASSAERTLAIKVEAQRSNQLYGSGSAITSLYFNYSGVVQLVALQTLDLAILVRVQAPEPIFS